MIAKLHPDVARFAAALNELEDHLRRYGECHWARTVALIRQKAERSDGRCVEEAIMLFGGMGSLNDLILGEAIEANDTLDRLSSKVWTLAQDLKS